MRRARAYSSSCSQVILVCLIPIHSSAAKSRKKSLKTPISGVQGHSRSSMLTFLKSSLPLLVMISSMSVPIWNHFYV